MGEADERHDQLDATLQFRESEGCTGTCEFVNTEFQKVVFIRVFCVVLVRLVCLDDDIYISGNMYL